MWAYLLVLLLLFSVAGGSGFPVLAETEHIEDVSTEAENMETAEMEAGETEAEEKAGNRTGRRKNSNRETVVRMRTPGKIPEKKIRMKIRKLWLPERTMRQKIQKPQRKDRKREIWKQALRQTMRK